MRFLLGVYEYILIHGLQWYKEWFPPSLSPSLWDYQTCQISCLSYIKTRSETFSGIVNFISKREYKIYHVEKALI